MSGRPFEFKAETVIVEALDLDPRVIEVFRRLGMRCWPAKHDEPCVAADRETLAEAALYHDMDLGKLLSELNALGVSHQP